MRNLLIMLGLIGILGCSSSTVQAHPAETAEVEVVVSSPPPPTLIEIRPIAPSVHHNWIEGYWVWSGYRYVWRPGFWLHRPGHRWHSGYWVRLERGWRYHRGFWVKI